MSDTTEELQAGPQLQAPEPAVSLEELVRSLQHDIEQILPAVLSALKRDRAFEELQHQLRQAQGALAAWQDLPLIVSIHDALLQMRQQGLSSDWLWMEQMLLDALDRVGVTEFGFPGEVVEPETVEITSASGEGAKLRVVTTHRPGLRKQHLPLRRPIVDVVREEAE